MAQDWQPALYARYGDERLQPVLDLLARVPFDRPRRVVDLGCGAAASTVPLVERWPEAEVVGLDTSPAMLKAARERLPGTAFVQGDVATWAPAEPVDLLFANAVLQWVPDHGALLPRLMGLLAPGGALAVQMPDNLSEPSHALMRELAAEAPFAAALRDAAGARTEIAGSDRLYDMLAPHAASVQIWRTVYHHPLAGPDAIVEMVRSTGLRPFLDPLGEADRVAYLARYTDRIAAAYPRRADGRVLFRFPRLFFVAVR
ncbi:trans-aconitate 2-methyltransferase [Prosthecomicrobium sp. N25]|uniref:trans-aconitate 2-methyltransferase n=1 Tax=Prosthecomicrobium sp. N25 TaxID=3129254 RepID=UPI00307752D6